MKKSSLSSCHIYTAILSMVLNIISFSIYAGTNQESTKNCLITATTIKKSKQVTNMLYIDVRNSHTFNEKHIPNSINIPLQLTATKAFLKNKDVILVGNGWNEPSLIQKCMQLKTKGFKSVKVLTGGIVSWFESDKTLSKRTLMSLSSKEFFDNKVEKKFVPLVISGENKKQINVTLPHAKIVPVKVTKRQLLDRLNRLGKGINPIVIFSDATYDIDAVINDYLLNPLRKIYYFEGGFNAYKQVDELNKMTSVSNQHKRLSTKKPVSCAN